MPTISKIKRSVGQGQVVSPTDWTDALQCHTNFSLNE